MNPRKEKNETKKERDTQLRLSNKKAIKRSKSKVGLRREKFDYPALMNRKPGANGENKKEGETHVVAAVPTWPNFPLA